MIYSLSTITTLYGIRTLYLSKFQYTELSWLIINLYQINWFYQVINSIHLGFYEAQCPLQDRTASVGGLRMEDMAEVEARVVRKTTL